MPANPFLASRAYASTGLETAIADASPEQLILMLHDGLLESLHRARLAMAEGRVAEKGEAVSKALAILTEGLMPALDPERGGDIAANLAALYEYMITRGAAARERTAAVGCARGPVVRRRLTASPHDTCAACTCPGFRPMRQPSS
jgi:flagellar biosynthetic protein FliS